MKYAKLAYVAFVLMFVGCTVSQQINGYGSVLPPNAKNIKVLNHKWVSFELNGRLYYYGQPTMSPDSSICFEVNKEDK